MDPVLISKTPGLCDCFPLPIRDDDDVPSVFVSPLVRVVGEEESDVAAAAVAVGSAVTSRDHSVFTFDLTLVALSLSVRSVAVDCKTQP